MSRTIEKTLLVLMILLGGILMTNGLTAEDDAIAIIGTIFAATGLIGTLLVTVIEKIELGAAAIVAGLISEDWGKSLDKAVKREMKKKEKKND